MCWKAASSTFRDFYRLFKHIGRGRQYVLLILLRCPVDFLFTWVNAGFLSRAFNAAGNLDSGAVVSACLFFGAATLGAFLYNFSVRMFFAPFCVKMERILRGKLYERIVSFPYERIESLPSGEWITRLNIDVRAPYSQPTHIPTAVCAMFNIIASSVVLIGVNFSVFGWILAFVIPHILFSQFFIARAMPGLNARSLESAAKNTGELTALITCADAAAIYDCREYLIERFEKSSLDLMRAKMKMVKRNALSSAVLPLFGLGGYLALLIAAGKWISDGLLTFGDLTAAFQFRGGVLLGSLSLINSLISVSSSAASARRLNELLI